MYLFAYGSLLSPDSLRATLPEVALHGCVPARCRGYVRTFDVAFPNDGSQQDKSYVDVAGGRPQTVLFANLRARAGGVAGGVCVPVDERQLHLLRRRELRYQLRDLTAAVQPYPGMGRIARPVLGFLGRPAFTAAEQVLRGVVPTAYLRLIDRGAAHWGARCAGLLRDYHDGTHRPETTADLLRIDHGGAPSR